MEDLLLPNNVLQNQVCDECFQYLSVPPTTINSRGTKVCGRCIDQFEKFDSQINTNAKSSYNIIAERFLFKCTNYLNGCTKVLSLTETEEHEKTCIYKSVKECFICSFTGNLSQNLHHSLKFHPENVSFDGTFSFELNKEFKKKIIICKYDTIIHLSIDVTEDVFTAIITPALETLLPTINQYAIKFFKSDDPSSFEFIQTDYGLFNIDLINCYKKNIGELVTIFGPAVQVTGQILLGKISLDDKNLEFQQRFAKLRRSEIKLNNYKQKIQVQEQELRQQTEMHNAAMNIIKKMSYNLFKCHSCEKISLKDTYYCQKFHCYCQTCLTSMCKLCKRIREFKKLEDIDSFIVSCDWPRCTKQLPIKDYLKHKGMCSERPYKCPLEDCHEIIFSRKKLIEHWHSEVPALIDTKSIDVELYCMNECYWLIQYDLYHVLINFTQSNINVLIDEVNVLPNNNDFKCMITSPRGGNVQLTSSTFFGKYHINVNSHTSGSAKIQITC